MMSMRLLAIALTGAAALADAGDHGSVALLLLLAAIPAAAIGALLALGDLLERDGGDGLGWLQLALTALAGVLVVASCALRGPLLPPGQAPALAVSVLVAALGLHAFQGALAAAAALHELAARGRLASRRA
jgi:hypothetical protein